MAFAALIVWVAAGMAAVFAAVGALNAHPGIALLASAILGLIAAAGGLVLFWLLASEIDFWRRGYRVRMVDRRLYLRWRLGPQLCVYEERTDDGAIRALQFTRVIIGDGYPAPSEIHLPLDDAWDTEVDLWARGRRSEIVERISNLSHSKAQVPGLPPNN
jgi:hypothetical protein